MIILRFFASLFLFLFAWLPVYLAGFLAVPVGLLFCSEKSEHLPWVWFLWENKEAGINGTLNGMNPKWPGQCGGRNRAFRYRFIWLAWRNPVSGLSFWLAPVIDRPVVQTAYIRGSLERRLMGKFWDYSLTLRYPFTRNCLFCRFGWKLSKAPGELAQLMNRFSPWKMV